MKASHLLLSALAALMAAAGPARATTVDLDFTGPGVSGSLVLTYGTQTDAKYPNAFKITAVSGTFSDTNNGLGIVDAPVVGLIPVTNDTPEPTNLLAPNDFSRFAVASGLPAQNHGFLTFDNLYWPAGSPQTASDYPPHGGALDIYGLMFGIGGGRVVDLWSNGVLDGGAPDYGVAVATAEQALDYVTGGVRASVPEPGSLWLFSSLLIAVGAVRRPRRGRTLPRSSACRRTASRFRTP